MAHIYVDILSLVGYRLIMINIRKTKEFTDWLDAQKDRKTVFKITSRIDRMKAGNFGDVKPVGEGVSELRIHYGPGFRVYFIQRGTELIILLCGGTKKTQTKDIKTAKELSKL